MISFYLFRIFRFALRWTQRSLFECRLTDDQHSLNVNRRLSLETSLHIKELLLFWGPYWRVGKNNIILTLIQMLLKFETDTTSRSNNLSTKVLPSSLTFYIVPYLSTLFLRKIITQNPDDCSTSVKSETRHQIEILYRLVNFEWIDSHLTVVWKLMIRIRTSLVWFLFIFIVWFRAPRETKNSVTSPGSNFSCYRRQQRKIKFVRHRRRWLEHRLELPRGIFTLLPF